MKKILVSNGDYAHTLGIVRSLSKEGFLVDSIGKKFCLTRFSKYLNKIAFEETLFNLDSIHIFLKFLSESNYDFFIPIGADAVYLTNIYREEINKFTNVIMAPKKSIEESLDKELLLSKAFSLGIFVPKTFRFDNYKDFKLNLNKIIFPVITKSKSEIQKQEVRYFSDSIELKNFMKKNKLIKQTLIQQRIVGQGIGFFALYKNGILKKFFIHKRIREIPLKGGSSTCAESYFDKAAYTLGKKLLDNLNWEGVAMVEFKKNIKDGKLYLMEVNPKFWGSHDLAIASGINFALEMIAPDNLFNENMKIEYIIGKKYQWPFLDIKTSHRNLNVFIKVIKDFFNLKVDNNLWIKDPMPIIYNCLVFFIVPFLRKTIFPNLLSRINKIGVKNAIIKSMTELTGIPLPSYSFIDNEISVGMQHSTLGGFILKFLNHNSVLNLRSELDYKNKFQKLSNYKQIKIKEYSSSSIEQLNEGSDFIHYSILNGKGKVYIHCREGVSRAPLFACAYLIKYKNFSIQQAIKYIKCKRKYINILPNQLSILEIFKNKI